MTFTDELARGIRHLLDTSAPFGTYNLTGSGDAVSWADIARDVYRLTGHDPERITPVSTVEYYSATAGPIAPRPGNSTLDLSKIEATGFVPGDSSERLRRYLGK